MSGSGLGEALRGRDERERQIDMQADRFGHMVVTYGLLVLALARAIFRNEAAWDLLGLVVLGGAASTLYRLRRRVVSRAWFGLMLAIVAASAVVAGVLAAFASHLV